MDMSFQSFDTRRAFFTAAATAATLCGTSLLAGCNTVEGVGQDVERLGDKIGDEARDQRRKNRE
jgi:predicted small secreted protein